MILTFEPNTVHVQYTVRIMYGLFQGVHITGRLAILFQQTMMSIHFKMEAWA